MFRTTSALLAVVALAGCGGAAKTSAPPTTSTTAPGASSAAAAAPTTTSSSVAPLQAEAVSAAAGDIPDNQVFVTYRGTGYSIKVPEGWTQTGHGSTVTFRDKNNVVRIVLQPHGGPRSKRTYRTRSAPNPVTGKRVTLVVDRYTIPHGNRTAVIDLGGAEGVDNVDAYRLISQSFRWR
jgi:hypothetical protein